MKLSHSSVDMLARCGEQYRFRYVEGIRSRPSGAAAVGTAVDAAVSYDLDARARGEVVAAGAVAERADGVLRHEWQSVEVHALDLEKSVGEASDRAVRLALGYRKTRAPFVPVERVGRWFSLALGDSGDELNGRTDVETLDGGVTDVKTRRQAPNAMEGHASDQLTGYALARRVLDGERGERVPVSLHVIVDRPKAPPGVVRADDPAGVRVIALDSDRTVEQMQAYLERVERARDVIRAGAFMPARIGEPLCSERFCGYWSQCRFSRRPVAVAMQFPDTGEE